LALAGCDDQTASDEAFSAGEERDAPTTPTGAVLVPGQNGAIDPQTGVPVVAIDGNPAGVPALPPEMEQVFEFELPHAGKRYVYAVNPDSDSVAVIDATTLAIQSVDAGDQPRYLQTLAERDAAVVLNTGSSDATVIRTDNGTSRTTTVDVQPGSNAIAVSPDGKHAVVYFDASRRSADANGSYQDLSVLSLEDGKETSVAMTVGFRPSAVSFSEDGKKGFVITEDGVSILDFAEIESKGGAIARTVPLAEDAMLALDVSVTPDGKYALGRREADPELRLANLETGELMLLDLSPYLSADSDAPTFSAGDAGAAEQDAGSAPAAPSGTQPNAVAGAAITDVDLAPSGQYALAVVRDFSRVLKVPVPGAFSGKARPDVFTFKGELIGSVSIAPDSEHALLYTTAVDSVERITLFDSQSGDSKVVRLPKAIASVTIDQQSKTALIVHKKLDGDPNEAGIDPEVALDRAYGYSVLDFATGFTKLQTAKTEVGPSTVVPDGSNLFVLFNDARMGVQEVQQVNLQSFVVTTTGLGSPPTSLGSVPASNKVFVGQDHPDGRIAFIDWETGDLESVTGFELNSRIRE
jgi:YVTN family beta-propeller protein